MKRMMIFVLVALSGSCTTLKEKTIKVPISYESTLNSLTVEESDVIKLDSLAGSETAPIRIIWPTLPVIEPELGGIIAYEFVVTADSVSVITKESERVYQTPVPGEKLTIRQGVDAVPKAVLEGAPEMREFEVTLTEQRSLISRLGFLAERIVNYLFRILIGAAILGVVALGGYITYYIVQSKKKEAVIKGISEVATDVIKSLRRPNIMP